MAAFLHFEPISALPALLASSCDRPRFAFIVFQLLASVADDTGTVGPFVPNGKGSLPVRDWLAGQLLPMCVQSRRSPTPPPDQENTLAAARTNVSRVVSSLVRAGLLERHYAGYATNHVNRGGGRHVVYVIKPPPESAPLLPQIVKKLSAPPVQLAMFA